jgi:hypothetical protein
VPDIEKCLNQSDNRNMPDEVLSEPRLPQPVRAPGPKTWIAVVVAFVLGLGAAGWLGWRSGADFGHFFGLTHAAAGLSPALEPRQPYAIPPNPALSQPPGLPQTNATQDEMALAGRVAAMEQRLDRIDLRVEAASGNAARAEALLVAFAVRRVVERGAPLGYLADQLKLRFGDAQPNAVATIITDSKDLVPLDQLAARLEALAPQLTTAGQQSVWNRVTRELSELFVIRRDQPARSDADVRFDDARKALNEGRIDEAVADVQHLSNGADAASWSAAARRYRDVESALDLIDTTALLEPHQLHDAGGNPVSEIVP